MFLHLAEFVHDILVLSVALVILPLLVLQILVVDTHSILVVSERSLVLLPQVALCISVFLLQFVVGLRELFQVFFQLL